MCAPLREWSVCPVHANSGMGQGQNGDAPVFPDGGSRKAHPPGKIAIMAGMIGTRNMGVSLFLLLLGWAPLPAAFAQSPYLYQGADREQKLVAGAKQEGQVSIYTSTQLPDFQPIVQAFEKKYG